MIRPLVDILESRRLLSGQPMISIGDFHMVEGNDGSTHAEVVVSLSKSRHNQAVTVNYATANGSAIAGKDYLGASGKLTFAPGQTSKTLLLPVIGDRLVEPHEYFFVNLQGAKGAKIADSQGMVEIIDDEPRINIQDAYAQEGSSGTTALTFTVSLFAGYDIPVSVNYTTANGSATAGSDYVASTGTVTFQPGETSKEISILINGDRLVEANETLHVNLSSPSSHAEIIWGSATGTIIDDEARISISDVWNEEGAASFTFTVSLSAASDEVVTVNFATADGTALAGTDYVATSGTVTFNPGQTTQTITVAVLDMAAAYDKWFTVHLSGASANAPIVAGEGYGYWYYDYGYYDPGYFDPYYDYYGWW